MLRNAISFGLIRQNFAIAMTQVIVLGLIALPLAGCGADGSGGPMLSSLSTSTAEESLEKEPPREEDPEIEDPPVDVAEAEPNFSEGGSDPDGEEDPTVSVTPTPTGATARLTWDASPDPTVSNYYVYYGKESSGEPGSCSYEESQVVESPPAIITGLEPNTPYFFAISASGGEGGESESPCSNEVLVVTPPAQS